MYANLNISHWFMSFQLGTLTDQELVRLCRTLFTNSDIRKWWAVYGQPWKAPTSRLDHRFLKLANNGYPEALKSSSNNGFEDRHTNDVAAVSVDYAQAIEPKHRRQPSQLTLTAVGAAIGAVVVILTTRHARRRARRPTR